MTIDALIFEVELAKFGVHAANVKRVLRAVAISQLPGASPLIEGIINVHGQVVAVLDFRGMLRLPAKEIEVSDQLIVLQLGSREVAIRIDRAVDLIKLEAEALNEAQTIAGGTALSGNIAKTSLGLVHLLDPGHLLSATKALLIDDGLATSFTEDAG